jgi:16S rRNA (guanine(966)-N(2))-methyltransferase RsmD
MSLRVISGSAKGRKLRDVPGSSTRPVTDRVKQALFNIISADAVGSSWLDLFGGTGAVGIEALSRGATFVRFVEKNRHAVDTIRENLSLCQFQDRAEIKHMDAFSMLESQADRVFDYIYIAPPQYQGLWLKTLKAFDGNNAWMEKDAWIIVQIHPKEFLPPEIKSLELFEQRSYGSTLLLFFSTQ